MIFGGFAVGSVDQRQANEALDLVLARGVNHIDIAPSYGEAETRVGPWLAQHRDEIFLGCKTQKRSKQRAREELHRSLDRLQTDHFDLYQLHEVGELEELDRALGPGGAIEAILEARLSCAVCACSGAGPI
jgi:aryl-alcohol dehydrogenase-like predicted oxidoreductase